jgi:hypothetical protein
LEVLGQVEATTTWLQVIASFRAVIVIKFSNLLAAEFPLGRTTYGVETGNTDEDRSGPSLELVILGRPTDAESLTSLLDSHRAVTLATPALSLVGQLRWVGQSLVKSIGPLSVPAVRACWLRVRVVVLLLEVAMRGVLVKLAERLFANREAARVAFTTSVLLKPALFLGILEFPVHAFNPRMGFGFLCEDEEGVSDNENQTGLGESGKDRVWFGWVGT